MSQENSKRVNRFMSRTLASKSQASNINVKEVTNISKFILRKSNVL